MIYLMLCIMMDNIGEVTNKKNKCSEGYREGQSSSCLSYNKKLNSKSFQVRELLSKTIMLIGMRSNKFGKWSLSREVHAR